MEIHFLVMEKSWKIVEKEWSPCGIEALCILYSWLDFIIIIQKFITRTCSQALSMNRRHYQAMNFSQHQCTPFTKV